MTKTAGVCAALCLLAFPVSAFAADAGLPLVTSNMPRAGFFVGLGGSYNSVKVDRDLYAVGVSNTYAFTGKYTNEYSQPFVSASGVLTFTPPHTFPRPSA